MFSYISLILGALLLFLTVFIAYRQIEKPNIPQTTYLMISGMFIGALLLLVLGDPSTDNVEMNKTGFHIIRRSDKVKNEIIDQLGAQIGTLKFQITALQKASEEQSKFNINVKNSVDDIADQFRSKTKVSATANIKPALDAAIATVTIVYRDGNDKLAASLQTALLKAGFKCSSINSSLQEVRPWLEKDVPGMIYIANANLSSNILDKLTAICTTVAAQFSHSDVYSSPDWTFKSNNAQIYLL